MADVLALLFVVACIAFAIRGIVRGDALSCSDCGGSCASCAGGCASRRSIELSEEQLAQIVEAKRSILEGVRQ